MNTLLYFSFVFEINMSISSFVIFFLNETPQQIAAAQCCLLLATAMPLTAYRATEGSLLCG